MPTEIDDLTECLRAIDLARNALAIQRRGLSGASGDALALVGAEIVAGDLERWQLTFQSRERLVPRGATNGECVTLGGEYFVTVDLRDGATEIRFGE